MNEAVTYPPYIKNNGEWTSVYGCRECRSIGDIMSMGLLDPCPNCGAPNERKTRLTARWIPEYSSMFWGIISFEDGGYWEVKDE